MNEQVLQQLENVNLEVDRLLSTSPLVIRKYTKHLMQSKGKGVRALSVLTCALDGTHEIHENAISFAAAIEVLHLATLVHDDVMDDADTRRGITTLHKKYGRKTAVICGDYLLALAMNSVASVNQQDHYVDFNFSDILMDVALGELKQHINNGNLDLTLLEYLDIIEGKTAKLFEASFIAGAITTTSDEDVIEQYQKLGHHLGMIFQISDDLIDFEETEANALKPVQSDFEQGVMTLPLIYTFEKEPELKKMNLTRELINEAVKRVNGVGYARSKSQAYYDEAVSLLNSMELTKEKREAILWIFDKAMR